MLEVNVHEIAVEVAITAKFLIFFCREASIHIQYGSSSDESFLGRTAVVFVSFIYLFCRM